MKKLSPLPLFILGLAIIIVGFIFILGFIVADWFTFANRMLISLIVIALMVALAALIVLLIALGIRNRGKKRWTAFLFVAVLLFGSSVFDPATIGIIGAPVGLLLLVLSGSKLITLRSV